MSKKGDVAKGNRIEREFFLKLQENGFVVWKSGRRVIWIKNKFSSRLTPITMNNDIHSLFDLHAKHPTWPDFNFWFQIAANAWKSGEDRKAIEDWPSGDYDFVCMVRKMDMQPFQIRVLDCVEKNWAEFDSLDDFLEKSEVHIKIKKEENHNG